MISAAARWGIASAGEATEGPHPELTDATLVEQLRAGDRSAEAVLYRRHAGRLARTVARLLASQAEAQDVVHDTFLAAFTALPKLRRSERFGAWLLQISVRLAHRRIRRVRLLRRLGFVGSGDDASLEALADPGISPDLRAELGLLDVMLARLPPRERIPWMLRRVEGYTLAEVADACGISLATAKRRISEVERTVRTHVRLEETCDE